MACEYHEIALRWGQINKPSATRLAPASPASYR
jgi:hypothetical protein